MRPFSQPPNTPVLLVSKRFLLALWALGWLSSASVWASTKYPEQRCLEGLDQEKFGDAVACFEHLMKQTDKPQYLLSLGLVHEKAGTFHAEQRPAMSCFHISRSIGYYRRYLQRTPSLQKERKSYILEGVARLVRRSGFAQLKLVSHPNATKAILRGYQRRWGVRLPHRFEAMCPGRYRLEVTHKGFQTSTKVLVLKRNQVLSHHVVLRLEARRPFQMPMWGWLLVSGAGLGTVGGVLYFVAENRRQTLEARLGQDLLWKENRNTAEGLSFAAVSLFVIAGLVVGGALVFSLATRSTTPPVSERVLRQTMQKSPLVLPSPRGVGRRVCPSKEAGLLLFRSDDRRGWGRVRCP